MANNRWRSSCGLGRRCTVSKGHGKCGRSLACLFLLAISHRRTTSGVAWRPSIYPEALLLSSMIKDVSQLTKQIMVPFPCCASSGRFDRFAIA